jgi:hypothetical protein
MGEEIYTKHNVLCLTKKGGNNNKERCLLHIPTDGDEDDVVEIFVPASGKKKIFFRGKLYPFLSIGKGVQGTVMTVGIKVKDDFPYDKWILYTDTSVVRKSNEETRQLVQQQIVKSF